VANCRNCCPRRYALCVLVLLSLHHCICVVDADVLRQLPILLQATGLICHILQDHITLGVLVVTQADQDDVSLVDPNLLAHLATDMAQALGAINALGFQAPVAKHAQHLSVLLPVLLENQLTLLLVLILSTTPAQEKAT
jgi:hypothetical protein